MEARDELDHMKSKLEESFHENGMCLIHCLFVCILLAIYIYYWKYSHISTDLLIGRLDHQEEEMKAMAQERDDVRNELETSISKAKDLELNSSILTEEHGTL